VWVWVWMCVWMCVERDMLEELRVKQQLSHFSLTHVPEC